MKGVLDGVRIVDQGTFITGPCASMMLADMGADVIKVEAAGAGDPYRNFAGELYSAHFQAYNRNKRSITLDLKSSKDRDIFRDLVRSADVYMQNFRPGVAKRIGADRESLGAINPRLIYCSISGFGPDGPYSKRPVYDSVAQAVSGFLGVSIDEDDPRFSGPALADAITGIYAALGVVGALLARARDGQGRLVEVSMLEAMAHFAIEPFMGYFALGEVPRSTDRPRLAQAYIVRCRDSKLMVFHLSSLEKFWITLVAAADAPELAVDPRFSTRQGRIDNFEALEVELNDIFAKRDRADWLGRFVDIDLPYAPINSVEDVIADPQAKHLELFVPVLFGSRGARETVRPALSFNGERITDVIAAPLLNEQGDLIRAALSQDNNRWPDDPRRSTAASGGNHGRTLVHERGGDRKGR